MYLRIWVTAEPVKFTRTTSRALWTTAPTASACDRSSLRPLESAAAHACDGSATTPTRGRSALRPLQPATARSCYALETWGVGQLSWAVVMSSPGPSLTMRPSRMLTTRGMR